MNWLRGILVACVLVPGYATAWCTKEHVVLTQLAVRELLDDQATPEEMKTWLAKAQPELRGPEAMRQWFINTYLGVFPRGENGLGFWAVYPDMIADSAAGKESKIEPFGVPEGLLHFIDLEYFSADSARKAYAPDLSNKPAIPDIPTDMKDPRWAKAGMLPFRIEQLYRQLIDDFRANRLVDAPGQLPRTRHATSTAGRLAHYAADNLMPMHATIDYQAHSYFASLPKEKRPRVHADMESRMVDDDAADYPELRAALWDELGRELSRTSVPPAPDVWKRSVDLSLSSYDLLPVIGEAARAAYLDTSGNLKAWNANAFFSYKAAGQQRTLLQLKARQQAFAVHWIASLYRQAWSESHAAAAWRAR